MRKIFSWHLYVCFRPSAMLHPQLSELQNIHREVASKQFELRDGAEPRKFLTPNTCFYTLLYIIMCTAFVYNHQFIKYTCTQSLQSTGAQEGNSYLPKCLVQHAQQNCPGCPDQIVWSAHTFLQLWYFLACASGRLGNIILTCPDHI